MTPYNIFLIINDIWNFLLIIMGIALSLFTLLYSFILTKKDQLLELSQLIKQGSKDPFLIQRQNNAIKYIKKLKIYNDKFIFIMSASFIVALLSWFTERFLKTTNESALDIIFYSIVTLTIIVLIYFLYTLILLIKNYIKDTKV